MEFSIRKHGNLDLFTCAGWQHTSASDVLVALGRVHIQLNNQFERLGELTLT
jgi:hypothetical protein